MDESEEKFWKEQFESLISKYDEVNDKMIKWAEKFGKNQALTSSSLEKITAKIDKPLLQTWDFWKTAAFLLIIFLLGIISIRNGGCIYIKEWFQAGNCQLQK